MSYEGRVIRHVVNRETGRRLMCCWTECENDGVELHKAVTREGIHIRHWVFCSERCKMYWVNSSKDMGNLPAGYKGPR